MADDLYTGLRQEFPSLNEEDAARATTEISKVAPQLVQSKPIEAPDPQLSRAEPQYIPGPEDAPKVDPLRQELEQMGNPEAYAAAKAKYDKVGKTNVFDHISNILSLTPRGGKFGSLMARQLGDRRSSAKADVNQRFEAMKYLGEYDRKQTSDQFAQSEEKRKQTKFNQEQDDRFEGSKTNSPKAQLYQNMLSKMSPEQQSVLKDMSEDDLAKSSDMVRGIYTEQNRQAENAARMEETKLARYQSGQQQNLSREQSKEISDRAFNSQQDEKETRKKQSVNEVEERRQNIKDAIGELTKMVDEKGTFEALGAHNQNLDRLIDQIATDMAKLQDQNSVARPGEVQLVKQNLIQSGFSNRNATAKDILKKFTEEVDRRADAAYKIRGLDIPESSGPPTSGNQSGTTKSVNDMTDDEVIEAAKAKGWLK